MAVTASPRFGLTRWSAGTDPITRAQLDASFAALDAAGAIYGQGTFAARPAAAAGNVGTFYVISDTTGGGILGATYYSTGATWLFLNPATVLTFGAAGDISASAPADTAAAGATGKVADAGHRHAREAFGAVSGSTSFGQAAANGSAGTLARSDHVHGTPATPATSVAGRTGAVTLTAADIASGAFPGNYTVAGTLGVAGVASMSGRSRHGFNGNVAVGPLATSAAEFEVSSQSMVTIGESAAGDANPHITFYRTSAGGRSGGALRQRMDATNGPFSWAVGSITAYGSETYTTIMTLSNAGALNTAGQLSENGNRVYSAGNPPPADGAAAVLDTVASPTGTYAVAVGVSVVLASGTFTVTVPAAAASAGRRIDVKNIGTGVITVATSGGNIDGSATAVIGKQYNSITLVSDGANWWIV